MTASYGLLSVVPALLTIVLAIVSRNVIFSLVVGVLCGSLILTGYDPLAAIINLVEAQLFEEVAEASQAQVLVTILVIGGFVRLLEISGGAQAFAARMAGMVTSAVKTQLMAWLTGLAVFFTDTGNSLIVGPLYRSVFSRWRLSREKLAYVLDSTSAPVCILVPFIGWGAYIMSLIEQAYQNAGLGDDAFQVLISVLPYQFYAFAALLTVPLIALSGRDFGPMLHTTPTDRAEPESESASESADRPESVGLFVITMGVMLGLLIGLSLWHAARDDLTSTHIRSTLIIAYASAALVCAWLMRRREGTTLSTSLGHFVGGAERLLNICMILVFAWSLGAVTDDLGTAAYISAQLEGNLSPALIPALIFVLGALISVATGSSYGTFAILMPLAVPLAMDLGAPLVVTIGAVLSGGLFGDHVSPISDTTVLASMGADCPHIDHVTTQAVYALLPGVVALLAYVTAGAAPEIWVLPASLAALTLVVLAAARVLGEPHPGRPAAQ